MLRVAFLFTFVFTLTSAEAYTYLRPLAAANPHANAKTKTFELEFDSARCPSPSSAQAYDFTAHASAAEDLLYFRVCARDAKHVHALEFVRDVELSAANHVFASLHGVCVDGSVPGLSSNNSARLACHEQLKRTKGCLEGAAAFHPSHLELAVSHSAGASVRIVQSGRRPLVRACSFDSSTRAL